MKRTEQNNTRQHGSWGRPGCSCACTGTGGCASCNHGPHAPISFVADSQIARFQSCSWLAGSRTCRVRRWAPVAAFDEHLTRHLTLPVSALRTEHMPLSRIPVVLLIKIVRWRAWNEWHRRTGAPAFLLRKANRSGALLLRHAVTNGDRTPSHLPKFHALRDERLTGGLGWLGSNYKMGLKFFLICVGRWL
jgi:hypothetical protein